MTNTDRIAALEERVKFLEERVARLNCRLNPAAGMQQTILHTASDPAGTPLGDLPTAAPTPSAPAEARYADGRLVNPGPPLSIPGPNTAAPDYPSLTSEDQTRREREKGIKG